MSRNLGFVPIALLLVLTGCTEGELVPGGHAGSGTSGTSTSGGSGGTSAGGVGPTAGSGGSGAIAGSGGLVGSGGTTGGAASGGAPTGGTGSGGTGVGGAAPTDGCGAATVPESGRYSIDVGGTMREYILTLPDGYDPSQPYRLVFGWHPRGGNAEQVAGGGFLGGYYGLENEANGSAIFVSPEGIDMGWANTGGRDIDFLQAMLDRFRAELCIDESRIFSTGFSYGGMMSFAVGCAMGDVFRAIAPMAGALYSGCENGTAPVAMWGSHGYAGGDMPDGVVAIADGRAARDVFLERNGCGTETTPVAPDECVAYQGCQAGYPVTWCEWDGGHSPPPFAGPAIWAFFSQF